MTSEISNPETISSNNLELNLNLARIQTEDEENVELNLSNIPSNTHINIDNSNDVVIGSVTQFHGPVTIIQNSSNNTQVETSDVQQSSYLINSHANLVATETLTGKPTSTFIKTPVKKRTLILIAIIFTIMLICISLSIYLSANTDQDAPSDTATGTHRLITRSTWGGRPPLYRRKIHQPTKYVIISHTASQYCQSVPTCSTIVANIQSLHVAKYNSPDVGYNFLIGGDENIYVGRGWDAENFHMENSIGISFIGNYIYDRLTPGMIEATQQLLNDGLNKKKLDENYKLISHNQTGNTESPGPNVYNVIRFWPYYSPELVPIT